MADQQHFQLVTALISAGSGLLGVIVGGLLAFLNSYRHDRRDSLRQKLELFYGPMLAIRARIKAKSELRLKLSAILGDEWAKLYSGIDDPELKKKIDQERSPQYQRVLDQWNNDLGEEIIPAYKKMAELFVAKMYLAEDEVRRFFPIRMEHVEILEMHHKNPFPREVAMKLDHNEKKLYPFYLSLDEQFRNLQKKLGIR